MAWDKFVARDTMLEAARTIGGDAYTEESEVLRASAGALFWAADQGVGVSTRWEFVDYLTKHVGWDQQSAEEWAIEVETKSLIAVKLPPPSKEKPIRTRYARGTVV